MERIINFFLDMEPIEIFIFLVFTIWGWPLGIYRSRFRKLVYETNSWIINIKPVFWKEIKFLLSNNKKTEEGKKITKFYRKYLIIYLLLFLIWQLARVVVK